ncbi:MAG: 30S ribosomal protein S5 [Patescibacteria group bacterium]|nr:30S ribosomal protein S5 [Patescibacteria group bacterium]
MDNDLNQNKELKEVVVEVKRVSKKTKGGNTIRFSALVVVGDQKGKVGVGMAKALDVSSAVRKSVSSAKKKMITVPLKGTTIPYDVFEKYSAAKVLIKPAPKGSGIIAGGPVRVVLEKAGIKDAVAKILGSKNKTVNVYAALNALKKIAKISQSKNAI